jgi:hypothetical protein
MRVTAKKMKKIPGFETPCRKAWRGKKAHKVPQIILSMKAMIEDGRASRLRRVWIFRDCFSDGMIFLLSNFIAMNREHKEIPVQTEKRATKLNRLTTSIPKYGPMAKAIFPAK